MIAAELMARTFRASTIQPQTRYVFGVPERRAPVDVHVHSRQPPLHCALNLFPSSSQTIRGASILLASLPFLSRFCFILKLVCGHTQ